MVVEGGGGEFECCEEVEWIGKTGLLGGPNTFGLWGLFESIVY